MQRAALRAAAEAERYKANQAPEKGQPFAGASRKKLRELVSGKAENPLKQESLSPSWTVCRMENMD